MSYFSYIQISVNLLNEKIIHWMMNGVNFKSKTSVSFYVDKARTGGEWEEVGGPIVDDCYYIDPVKWNWGKDLDTYYRVRFKNESNEWVYSTPTIAFQGWTFDNFRWAKEICRKEMLSEKALARPGVLLKRKEWGVPCTICRDWDSRDVVNTNCPSCYGVGIVGGYYSPIPLDMNFKPVSIKRDISAEGLGVQQQEGITTTGIMYPWIKAYDIWADSNTGDRFVIQMIQVIAEMRGVPLIAVYSLRRLPKSDIIHSVEANQKVNTPPVELPAGTGNEYTWSAGLDCVDNY